MELRNQGATVYQFEGGEPFIPTPDVIKDAAKQALDKNQTRYAPSSGIPELREAIAEKLRRRNGIPAQASDVMVVNGHNTYLPIRSDPTRWILNDTYPDASRLQHPYLYDTRTSVRHPLGHFRSAREYTGEWRCDNHPRSSPDGTKVCIDSPHGGGRQMYLIDVKGIVGG